MAVVLITGAGSGIGLEAALAFARNGDRVIASMRNLEKGDTLLRRAAEAGLEIEVACLDVTNSESFAGFAESLINRHGRLDVLVNNAGILPVGSLEDVSEATFRQVMDVNCIGPLMLSRAFLPQFRAQRSGLIIMMSSLSGIAGLPGDLPYSASKFALEGATEALRHEVDRWGIRVALVQAAMYATDIFDSDTPLLPEDYPADSAYKALIETRTKAVRARLPEARDPRIVAEHFVNIANSNEDRLRWPADEVATSVLATTFAQTDAERDKFLQNVASVQWWSQGQDAPDAT